MPEKIEPIALTPRFADALTYAERVHASQSRKGTRIPYIAHPLGVASIALEHGVNEDETIAALLHDAIEDSPDPLLVKEDIRRRFGVGVAAIVEGCSDSEPQPKPPWLERKGTIHRTPRCISFHPSGLGFGQALQRPGHPRGLPGDR